jgi:hypothetical protein
LNPPLRRRRIRKHPSEVSSPAQRRLAIFSRPRTGRLSRQVAISLGSAGRLGKTVKEIAFEIQAPIRTVYRSIHRLESLGVVEKRAYGYALCSVVGDVTSDPSALLGFENIRWKVTNWQLAPPPPCRTAQMWHEVGGGSAGKFETAELAWEGRQVALRFYPSAGTLEVVIAAKEPIPLLQAAVLEGWLKAMLGLGRGETSECTHLEVNARHEAFRADGFKYLEIRRLGEFAQVLYQKTAGLKHEVRLYRPLDADGEKVSIERSLEILTEGSPLRVLLKIVEREIELVRARVASGESDGTAKKRSPEDYPPSSALSEGFG